jgi:hypothetical protein
LNTQEFIIDPGTRFWVFQSIRPFRKIRLSSGFRDHLDDIARVCDRMINCMENEEWLELE